MKILSLLIALLVSHHWPGIVRLRRYDWLLALLRKATAGGPDWLPAAALVALALAGGGLASWLAWEVAGLFGLLLLGIATVLLTLGPHDLDRDLTAATDATDETRRQSVLARLLLRADSTGIEGAAAALHAALARWFGIVFWFALIGVPGCLLYRCVREAHHDFSLGDDQRRQLGRLLGWLNWPVMFLIVAALALMTDFDRVRAVFMAREDRWQLPAALLDDLAAELCDAEGDLEQGLRDGRRLAWRALSLWLAVLSLLLLAGLVS